MKAKRNEITIRTDLALEGNEAATKVNRKIHGVDIITQKDKKSDIRVSTIRIKNTFGEKSLGKPKGIYVTIEAKNLIDGTDAYRDRVAWVLSKKLLQILDGKSHVLIAGLGNRDVTADSLGPRVLDNVSINRNLQTENDGKLMLTGIAPGVLGQTGVETAVIIKGVASQTKPDAIIAIDALSARNTNRLNRTIQISDTGIIPGSGVGNHRWSITKETMGVPVIAVGVPTVTTAPAIVTDSIEKFLDSYEKENGKINNRYELICNIMPEEIKQMYVTPKDIDADIVKISDVISNAFGQAV